MFLAASANQDGGFTGSWLLGTLMLMLRKKILSLGQQWNIICTNKGAIQQTVAVWPIAMHALRKGSAAEGVAFNSPPELGGSPGR